MERGGGSLIFCAEETINLMEKTLKLEVADDHRGGYSLVILSCELQVGIGNFLRSLKKYKIRDDKRSIYYKLVATYCGLHELLFFLMTKWVE